MVAQAQTAQPDPERAPKNTPGIPPLMRPERPSSDPYRPIPPESPPEGVMIVKPNPRAWQSPEAFQAPGSYQAPPEASEIYFHRQDPTGWPAALSKFAQSLEIRYFDWYSGTIGGALDEDVAWIFEELESAAAEGSDYEYSDYDRLWTSESLKAFLAQNLQALAVDREGYWHYMTIG